MKTAMHWQISRTKSLSENIAKAATYYSQKYGRMPNLCLVNPKDATERKTSFEDVGTPATTVTVQQYHYVQQGTLLIGVDEIPDYAKEEV